MSIVETTIPNDRRSRYTRLGRKTKDELVRTMVKASDDLQTMIGKLESKDLDADAHELALIRMSIDLGRPY